MKHPKDLNQVRAVTRMPGRRSRQRFTLVELLAQIAIIATFVVMSVAASAGAEPLLTHTDVFISGENGYHTYRIPAVEAAPDGSLIAFAEARKYNAADPGFGKQEIDLVYKRSTNNGATWSPMTVLEHAGELWSAANPATVVDRTNGRLWVFYMRSRPGCSTDTSRPGTDDMQTIARWSDTSGQTWSEPVDLTAVGRDMNDKAWRASVPGPGGAIQTRKGRLIVPMWKMPPANFAIYSTITGAPGSAAKWSRRSRAATRTRSSNWPTAACSWTSGRTPARTVGWRRAPTAARPGPSHGPGSP